MKIGSSKMLSPNSTLLGQQSTDGVVDQQRFFFLNHIFLYYPNIIHKQKVKNIIVYIL